MSYFHLNKIDAIESTNSALKLNYQKGDLQHGEGIWALNQTKGKGQREATWISQPNKNLTFSFFLRHKNLAIEHPFQLNCLVTLAIKSTLNLFNIPAITIKWPNDILSENRKLCGILIENIYRGSAVNGSIVGIGLNVNQDDFSHLPKASSMCLCSGRNFKLEDVLDVLLNQLEVELTSSKSYSSVRAEFTQALYGHHKALRFKANGREFEATIEGITSAGLLSVVANGQRQHYNFKEIEMLY
ncbi:MAG: biotin--[acetyl-CoA-carboxylase] ligase [Flavobacteriaceae bacterium]